ncbi:acetyl synthetase [Fusarium phyllophilum]|uniref:Acetyl synthetase n=1 Tax=Fusarium phyllophilum TaxID=47803 RepID=A0A8H5J226_9HYPO|nr:acetyl synthetase [Fusarium phyllophilum]
MAGYKTHLTVLQETAQATPLLPALKIPQLSSDGELQGWKDISYSQLLHDVEQSAKYWSRELSKKGIDTGSVIGLWLRGITYLDLLHIWGISRAGRIPQLISVHLTSNTVVGEVLSEAKAKGLIHDPAIAVSVGEGVSTFPVADFLGLAVEQAPLAEINSPTSGEEILFILHSSGSMSGKPKLVPATARWLDCNIRKAQHFTFRGPGAEYQETVVANGSFLTVLNMFSSFLGGVIKEARKDPELLAILQRFDACTYGGLPLEETEAAWAREQGINLVDLFASTEVGCMLMGVGGRHGNLLRIWPESTFEMRPISVAPDDTVSGAPSDAANGDFITGDVFLQVEPDRFISKGRNDDWIKMEFSLRCDTRSIENNALETCGKDLISAAVVVGAARPSPALFVEVKQTEGHDELKSEILRRITAFHERRYKHERILDSRLIIVVPHGALPRTAKGSIQRKVFEREFKEDLDRIYSEVYPKKKN